MLALLKSRTPAQFSSRVSVLLFVALIAFFVLVMVTTATDRYAAAALG